MYKNYLTTLLFVLLVQFFGINSECPKPELLYPCTCNSISESITCSGNQSINLKQIFNDLSKQLTSEKKHFKRFFLTNTAINKLEENTFSNITFDTISILKASSLSLIHKNTFNGIDSLVKNLYATETPLTNSPPDYDLFDALSSLTNVEGIGLYGVNITEIPDNAFKPINGYQNSLNALWITGKVKKLGNNAFYNLNSLTTLGIWYNLIDSIPPNAFNFKEESNKTFNLFLDYNALNGSNSDMSALLKLKRPTILHPDCRQSPCTIKYLDEKIFYRFLELNEHNKVGASENGDQIDCNDCRSFWIKTKGNYAQRFLNFKCTDGKLLADNNNFENCKN